MVKLYKVETTTFGGVKKIKRVFARSTTQALNKVKSKVTFNPLGKTLSQIRKLEKNMLKRVRIIK